MEYHVSVQCIAAMNSILTVLHCVLTLCLNIQSQTLHCLMPKKLQFIYLAGSSGLEGRNHLPAMEWCTGSHHPLWGLCQMVSGHWQADPPSPSHTFIHPSWPVGDSGICDWVWAKFYSCLRVRGTQTHLLLSNYTKHTTSLCFLGTTRSLVHISVNTMW